MVWRITRQPVMASHGSHHGSVYPATRGRTIHWAVLYDLGTTVLSFGRDRAVRAMVLELAGLRPGDAVLDIGCGPGNLAIAAAALVRPTGRVHGIDAAPEMTALARRKAARRSVNVDFAVGVMESLAFADGEFDAVLNTFVLHHLPDDLKRAGFREIRRVLKPGGRFVAVDFASEPRAHALIQRLLAVFRAHEPMHHGVDRLPAMLAEAGFIDVSTGRTPYKSIAFLRGSARPATPGV